MAIRVHRGLCGDDNSESYSMSTEKFDSESSFHRRVGILIDEIRSRFGLNQREVAARLGVEPSSLSDAKAGKTRRFSKRTLAKFGIEFGVNPAWLSEGRGAIFLEKGEAVAEERRRLKERLQEVADRFADGKLNELAERVGVEPGGLHSENPGHLQLAAVREKLGVDLNWLLTGEGEMIRAPGDLSGPWWQDAMRTLQRRINELEGEREVLKAGRAGQAAADRELWAAWAALPEHRREALRQLILAEAREGEPAVAGPTRQGSA